ncbi:hypothetical protein [Antiquaquibacter soli]|uniref:N-acetyltransferase domain-containing protein n=1 Tax=Antiquaquibacter soli TaxID=3064523 RepID=A0ABT9BQK8_9MICO|nr:hypothetical protein [Protaetiibacter sp. WY-16]MDO7883303.1 hypothetical protein [Protaetiibacter sp. WY-16]
MKTARNARYVRRGRLSSGLWDVAAYGDDSVADGTIDDGGAEPDIEAAWSVTEADAGLAHVAIGRYLLPEQPALWFVWVDEPSASPAATNLVAFGGDRFPAGTIISRYAFATARVPNGEQAGAVRWYPRDGLVHQIFVAPEWRRRFVASTLLYTADAFHQANGWAGKLHGDGRRTALGQVFTAALRHPNRARQLTEEMPPMDEGALGRARE